MKTCNKCKEQKSDDEFGKNSWRPSGRMDSCKECANADNRQWRIDNPETYSNMQRSYRKKHPKTQAENASKFYYRTRYGMTKEEYKAAQAAGEQPQTLDTWWVDYRK